MNVTMQKVINDDYDDNNNNFFSPGATTPIRGLYFTAL